MFVARFVILTFIGMRPVEEPYQILGQVRSLIYFRYYPIHCILERSWDVLIGYLQFRLGRAVEGEVGSHRYDGRRELG